MCAGPASRNLNVIFSGEATLPSALTAAFQKQATALRMGLSETRSLRPFSADAGIHTGMQFISLGGSNAAGAFSNETLHGAGFTPKGLASVKAAGFSGICFDVEVTEGSADALAAALEAAFLACKKAGMLVMVTTSHTAPYAAATDHTKRLLVDSWVKSSSIDIFSPQLYTSGYEPAPQFELTTCLPTDTLFDSRCSWERLKPMKAAPAPKPFDPRPRPRPGPGPGPTPGRGPTPDPGSTPNPGPTLTRTRPRGSRRCLRRSTTRRPRGSSASWASRRAASCSGATRTTRSCRASPTS